jgi:hypothetical protein
LVIRKRYPATSFASSQFPLTVPSDVIKTVREGRDNASERLFDLIYATPLRPNAGRAGKS